MPCADGAAHRRAESSATRLPRPWCSPRGPDHGGRARRAVLLSQATCSVLEDDDLPGIRILRDLGQHNLKDIDRPEHIYQLEIEGLPAEFPPLRTVDAPTAYSGREHELEKAARALVWRQRLRSRRLLAPVLVAIVVAAAVAAVHRTGMLGGSGTAHALPQVEANAVGVIDPKSDEIAGDVPVGRRRHRSRWVPARSG